MIKRECEREKKFVINGEIRNIEKMEWGRDKEKEGEIKREKERERYSFIVWHSDLCGQ